MKSNKKKPSKSRNDFLKVNLKKKRFHINQLKQEIPPNVENLRISQSVDTTEAIKFGKQYTSDLNKLERLS